MEKTTDTIVQEICEKFQERSRVGIAKYGTTLDRTDLTFLDWINHALEEHMDAILYLQRAKHEIMHRRDLGVGSLPLPHPYSSHESAGPCDTKATPQDPVASTQNTETKVAEPAPYRNRQEPLPPAPDS